MITIRAMLHTVTLIIAISYVLIGILETSVARDLWVMYAAAIVFTLSLENFAIHKR